MICSLLRQSDKVLRRAWPAMRPLAAWRFQRLWEPSTAKTKATAAGVFTGVA